MTDTQQITTTESDWIKATILPNERKADLLRVEINGAEVAFNPKSYGLLSRTLEFPHQVRVKTDQHGITRIEVDVFGKCRYFVRFGFFAREIGTGEMSLGANGQFTDILVRDALIAKHRPEVSEKANVYKTSFAIYDGTDVAQWHVTRRSCYIEAVGPMFKLTAEGLQAVEEVRARYAPAGKS